MPKLHDWLFFIAGKHPSVVKKIRELGNSYLLDPSSTVKEMERKFSRGYIEDLSDFDSVLEILVMKLCLSEKVKKVAEESLLELQYNKLCEAYGKEAVEVIIDPEKIERERNVRAMVEYGLYKRLENIFKKDEELEDLINKKVKSVLKNPKYWPRIVFYIVGGGLYGLLKKSYKH